MPSSKQIDQPPVWAQRFLWWFCKEELYEDIEGDLYEYYSRRLQARGRQVANIMYVVDVLRLLKPYVVKNEKLKSYLNPIAMIHNNFKSSLRSVLKNRLTTSLNVIGLATGMASFLLIYLWINDELTFDQFHEKSHRIYRVSNSFESSSESFSQAPSGPALGSQLPLIVAQIESGVRVGRNSSQIQVGDKNFFETNMRLADSTFFDIFDFKLLKGNPEKALSSTHSVVITERIAKKYFGEEDPIGQQMLMDGEHSMFVTAVAANPPKNSQLDFDFIIPMQFLRDVWGSTNMDNIWIGGWFHTYLLAAEGAKMIDLEEKVNDVVWEYSGGLQDTLEVKYSYFLQPLEDIHLKSQLRYDHSNNGSMELVYAFGTVGLIVLLLACINYMNLATANSISRAKEIGVRKVNGAYRGHLIWQFLTESLLLVTMATATALVTVHLLLPGFQDFTGKIFDNYFNLKFVILVSALTLTVSLLAGVYPAFVLSSFKSTSVLKGNFRSSIKGNWVRKALIVFQFVATVALLIFIFTVQSQLTFMANKDLGMKTDEILRINFRGLQEVRDNFDVLKNELLSSPNITAVSGHRRAYPVAGLSNGITLVENGDGEMVSSSLYHMWVDPDYAATFDMEIVAGRFYSRNFPADSLQSVVVNEAAVRTFGWTSVQDAIGKRFGQGDRQRSVVGVVKDFHFEGLRKNVEALRILPLRGARYDQITIRANLRQQEQVIAHLENSWQKVLPNVPLEYTFMNEDIKDQYRLEEGFKSVFIIFSVISIIIACLGLFGLATFAAQQRVKEIGIRKVLGASVTTLLQTVSRDFVILVVIALLIASPLAYFVMESWLAEFAYRIAVPWWAFLASGALSLVIAMLAISYQSLKASFGSPISSIRDE